MLPAGEVLRERGNRPRSLRRVHGVTRERLRKPSWPPARAHPSERHCPLGSFPQPRPAGRRGWGAQRSHPTLWGNPPGGPGASAEGLGPPRSLPPSAGAGARVAGPSRGGRWGQCSASAGGVSRAASGGPPLPAAPSHFRARRGARRLVSAVVPAPAPGVPATPGRRGRQRALPSADQAEGRGPAPLGGLGRLSPVWPGSGVRAGVRPGKTEAAGSAARVRPATGSSCPRPRRSRQGPAGSGQLWAARGSSAP